MYEIAFQDYQVPPPQNFESGDTVPDDPPPPDPSTFTEFEEDVETILAGTGGTISDSDLLLVSPDEWESFLLELLGFVDFTQSHGSDQNSYYDDHSDEAPMTALFIHEWGWLQSVRDLPGYHYFDYLTQDIDPEFLEWAYAVHSQVNLLRETGVHLATIENQPFTLFVHGTPLRVVWHSGTPPAANLHHVGDDTSPIVVTANIGYFTVQPQDDDHPFATAAADYMAWTPENGQYMSFVNQALQYLAQSPDALQLMFAALQAGVTIKIVTGDSPTRFNNDLNQVEWNPGLGYRLTGGGIMSPAMALIHEMAHAVDRIVFTQFDADYGTTEERRVITTYEQAIAALLGEPTREDHNAQAVHVPTVVYHTPNLPPPG